MIGINNLTVSLINEEFLREIVRRALRGENLKGEKELSVVLVGQGRMRNLNKRYRKKNRVTDVLSFDNLKNPVMKDDLGEIVICLREVKKNARKLGVSFEEELYRVLIHGLLHLLGYEHTKGKTAAEKMRKKEEYYLFQIKELKNNLKHQIPSTK